MSEIMVDNQRKTRKSETKDKPAENNIIIAV